LVDEHATTNAKYSGRGDMDQFQDEVPGEILPNSAKHEREAEFLTLQQGSLSVQDYVERFEYLSRFYSQTVTEEWRCRKFEGDLKHELRRFIVPLRVREFPILVEQAKSVEQLEKGPSLVNCTQRNSAEGRL